MILAERLRGIDGADEGFYAKFALTTLVDSAMRRAIQTADIIAPMLPGLKTRRRTADLNEGRPCLPEPPPSHREHYTNDRGDSERIERAFRSLVQRPPPLQSADSYEVVVWTRQLLVHPPFPARAVLRPAIQSKLRQSIPY